MGEKQAPPDAPSVLSPGLVEEIDELGEAELRAVIDYARRRQQHLHSTITEQIEPAPGEELVRVEEREGYTEVLKREPCGEDCPDCPHGPYLYHVHEEKRPDGERKLHWRYLGQVEV